MRVLLVCPPGVLRDIVRGVLEGQPDIVIAGEVDDPGETSRYLARTGADVVVWRAVGDDTFDRHGSLFERHPHLTVIAIERDGRQGFLWRLRPHLTVLREVSAPALLMVIRRVPRH